MPYPTPTRRPKGETWDQIPQWFMRHLVKSGDFAKFDELAFKLLVYFAKARSSKDLTPWTTNEKLSELVGAGPKRTKRAVGCLREIGVIRQTTECRQIRFHLVFKDPYDHFQDQDTAGQIPPRHRWRSTATPTTNEPATATASTASTRSREDIRQTPMNVDVHLDASVEGRFPSGEYAETEDNPARYGTQSGPKGQATKDDDPAWLHEQNDEPKQASGYTAGEDVDSGSQGRPQ